MRPRPSGTAVRPPVALVLATPVLATPVLAGQQGGAHGGGGGRSDGAGQLGEPVPDDRGAEYSPGPGDRPPGNYSPASHEAEKHQAKIKTQSLASADVTVFDHVIKYAFDVRLRYCYRLYPTLGQQRVLSRAFSCARVVFNDGLRIRQQAHETGRPYVTDSELSARLTAAKATDERAWLNDVSSVVLQQALADLNAAYRNFFASRTGKRRGPKIGAPKFRSRKDHRQAIRFTANARFKVLPNGKLRLPKIGDIPVRWSRPLPSEPSSVTVIRDCAGRYFASFVILARSRALPGTEAVIGIDLGLKYFAVLSDGAKSNPHGSCAARRRS